MSFANLAGQRSSMDDGKDPTHSRLPKSLDFGKKPRNSNSIEKLFGSMLPKANDGTSSITSKHGEKIPNFKQFLGSEFHIPHSLQMRSASVKNVYKPISRISQYGIAYTDKHKDNNNGVEHTEFPEAARKTIAIIEESEYKSKRSKLMKIEKDANKKNESTVRFIESLP